jgi:hypothetical protein
MAVLINPLNNPAIVEAKKRQAREAANSLGLQMIHVLQASTERDLDDASAWIARIQGSSGPVGFVRGKLVKPFDVNSWHV